MGHATHLIDQCSEEDRARVLAAAWVVAFADGRLWREKGLLETIRRELDVPKEAAREIEWRTREGKQGVYVPRELPARQVMFHYALTVAASDGRIDKRERRIAQRVGKALGLGTKEISSQLDRLAPSRTIRTRARRRLPKHEPSSEQSEAKSEALRRFLVTIGGREVATTPFGSFLIDNQSAIILVLANLVPIFGVLYFDWPPGLLLKAGQSWKYLAFRHPYNELM